MDANAVTSCGVLIWRDRPARGFLLLRVYRTLDLPKGVRHPGEADLACALRELQEETGIPADAIALDPDFSFTTSYPTTHEKRRVSKTLVVFLARLEREVQIRLSEHHAWMWMSWPASEPLPQRLRDLLDAATRHLAR